MVESIVKIREIGKMILKDSHFIIAARKTFSDMDIGTNLRVLFFHIGVIAKLLFYIKK